MTVSAFNMLNWEKPDNTDVAFFDSVEKALAWNADLIIRT